MKIFSSIGINHDLYQGYTLGRKGDFQNDLHELVIEYKVAEWLQEDRLKMIYKNKKISINFQEFCSLDNEKKEKFFSAYIRK